MLDQKIIFYFSARVGNLKFCLCAQKLLSSPHKDDFPKRKQDSYLFLLTVRREKKKSILI